MLKLFETCSNILKRAANEMMHLSILNETFFFLGTHFVNNRAIVNNRVQSDNMDQTERDLTCKPLN